MTELKPCPFCGASAYWVKGVSEDLGFFTCSNRCVKMEGYYDDCLTRWNRRVKE